MSVCRPFVFERRILYVIYEASKNHKVEAEVHRFLDMKTRQLLSR